MIGLNWLVRFSMVVEFRVLLLFSGGSSLISCCVSIDLLVLGGLVIRSEWLFVVVIFSVCLVLVWFLMLCSLGGVGGEF